MVKFVKIGDYWVNLEAIHFVWDQAEDRCEIHFDSGQHIAFGNLSSDKAMKILTGKSNETD